MLRDARVDSVSNRNMIQALDDALQHFIRRKPEKRRRARVIQEFSPVIPPPVDLTVKTKQGLVLQDLTLVLQDRVLVLHEPTQGK